MSRKRKDEELQQRLRQWQNTSLPAHREQRVQDALNNPPDVLLSEAGDTKSDGPENKRKSGVDGKRGFDPSFGSESGFGARTSGSRRWRGRLTGISVTAGVFTLVIVAAVTIPHGSGGAQSGSERGASQGTQRTTESAASSSTAGAVGSRTPRKNGLQQGINRPSNSSSTEARASLYIPANIAKVVITIPSLQYSSNTRHHRARHYTITASTQLQSLRQTINHLQSTTQKAGACKGKPNQTATLTFTSNNGQQVAATVDGTCGLVSVGGTTLVDKKVWPELTSIIDQK